jgi:hypothetical protein
MSKITEEMLDSSIELKSEHLDAMHLINKFMQICRDTQQTPKSFEKSMHDLYDNARKYGF